MDREDSLRSPLSVVLTRRRLLELMGMGAAAAWAAPILAACGGPAATTGTTSGTPKKGGSVTLIHQFETRGYDPVLSSGAVGSGGDAIQFQAVFDSLVYEDQYTGKIVPRIAQSFQSSDATNWTLKLRTGVKFSDGTPYDADAVKFNLERHADPANKSSNAGAVQGIASMTAVDPQTLRITLKAPNGQFDRVVARRVAAIASPTALRSLGSKFATQPVGAGPFLLDSWVRDSEARYKRNPNHWDSPRPYLDIITIRQVSDPQQRYNTVRSGEAQIGFMSISSDLAAKAKSDGLALYQSLPSGGLNMLLNERKAPFNNKNARQAVAYALNYARLNDVVYQGANVVPTHLFSDNSPFYDATLKLPQYDKTKAQQLLDQVAAQGKPLEFTFLHSPTQKAVAEFFQAQLAEFKNIKMNIAIVQNTDILPKAAAGDYEMMSFQIAAIDPEPDFYDGLHTGGVRNFGAYSSPDMDGALDKGRASLDQKVRTDAYKTFQKLLATDVPTVFYSKTPISVVADKKVQGIHITNFIMRWENINLSS
jgi:peptide/nickel transport system substrate-binding protein